ncbi:uncharacterized protein LOC128727496 [Anopheles nili]|uniref:uncharacterized protein LOC128727496 n=1 Tax=Anopheles nili TaxID=185578 RepID=UPI00237A896C|nr:uncharacterized protein LOC128727496 [Anopheles nili]
MRPTAKANVAAGRAILVILVSLATVSTIGAVPTSVLADSKEANGHHDVTASPGQNQLTTDDATYGDERTGPSNPQKRGVNPLLYREAELRSDFSGNSIPQNGVWEDVEVPLPGLPYPMELFDAAVEPGFLDRAGQQRTYDVLQALLNRPSPYSPLYVGRPVPGGLPMRLHGPGGAGGNPYGERKKRTSASSLPLAGKSHSHLMRLKRNSGKLSPAEVFSLLALMDSRDPYRPLQPLPEYIPEGANDALAYAPNGLYPDMPLPLALEQLLGGHAGNLPADGYAYEDAGEWLNGWTEPSVDYLGLPVADLESLGGLNEGKGLGPVNGFAPQQRFMVSKKKRSVSQVNQTGQSVAGCKAGDATCTLQKHYQGTIQATA